MPLLMLSAYCLLPTPYLSTAYQVYSTTRMEVDVTRSYKNLLIVIAAFALASCSMLKKESNPASCGAGGAAANSNRGQSPSAPRATAAGTPTTWEEKASSLNGKDAQPFTL